MWYLDFIFNLYYKLLKKIKRSRTCIQETRKAENMTFNVQIQILSKQNVDMNPFHNETQFPFQV